MDTTAVFGAPPTVVKPSNTASGKNEGADQLKLDFLKLLTTQLQYQDPLSPTQNTEFTSQMAQFSSLDAQNKSNDLLKQLLSAQGVGTLNQAVSYMGKQVVVPGNQTTVKNGAATVRFQMPETADAKVYLYNQSGALVKEVALQNVQSGERSAVVNGIGGPDGAYTFAVGYTAADGSHKTVSTMSSSQVVGVINDPAGVMLDLGGWQVSLTDVRRVEQTVGTGGSAG
ncbi:MAG: flagellar hook assembly protein FlgD [Magnetococcus sp. YQC-3]